MPNYRRAKFAGGYYFFTVVTHRRRKLFLDKKARDCLRYAISKTQSRASFENIAMCLLPDHLHCIWKLPAGDADFSNRWRIIKSCFTQRYLTLGGIETTQSKSRHSKRERAIWQRRFSEHQIRDEKDLQRRVDYIHYNPVKHALADKPQDWLWSTYHEYVQQGFYAGRNWQWITTHLSDIVAGK